MVIVVLFALAGLFFLVRAILSSGAALRVKQLVEELALGRIEITQLMEQNLVQTAREKALFYQKKIDVVCEQLRIPDESKHEQIPSATEFEDWWRSLLGETPIQREPAKVDVSVVKQLPSEPQEVILKKESQSKTFSGPKVQEIDVFSILDGKNIHKVDQKVGEDKLEELFDVPDDFLNTIHHTFGNLEDSVRGTIGIYLYLLSAITDRATRDIEFNKYSIVHIIPNLDLDGYKVPDAGKKFIREKRVPMFLQVNGSNMWELKSHQNEVLAYLVRYITNGANVSNLPDFAQLYTLMLYNAVPKVRDLINNLSFEELESRMEQHINNYKMCIQD